MRVGLYLHHYPPASGGAFTFQREIFRAISELSDKSDHQFFVLAHPSGVGLDQALPQDKLQHIPIEQPTPQTDVPMPQGRGWFRRDREPVAPLQSEPRGISALDNAVRKHKIEFIWFPTPAYEPIDVPYIATMWDLQHRLQPWFPEVGNLVEWNGRESYISGYLRRATYVIAANELAREDAHSFYQVPTDRIICLHYPAPGVAPVTEEKGREILNEFGLVPGYLFYPAQFWPHKNHASLLHGLRVLKEEHQIILQAVFVGSDKGNLAYVQQLAVDMGLQSQVHFLGFVTEIELSALYRNALALVFLSFFGPENLPPLEAFSAGCPVIASRVRGTGEQLGDAALLVSPTDPEEIALSIKSLLEDGLRQRLIKLGYARAEHLSSSKYVSRVLELLGEFEAVRRAWGGAS